MSQMGSVGSGSGNSSAIRNIVTDAGTANPINGVVNVLGSTNITVNESSNNVLISLKDDIVINSATFGHIHVEDNTISNTENDENILLSTIGSGKAIINNQLPSGQLYTGISSEILNAPLSDGEVLIGSSSSAPQGTSLTAGPGISITNAPGSITVSSSTTGGGKALGFSAWDIIDFSAQPGQSPYFDTEINKGYVVNCYSPSGTADLSVIYAAFVNLPNSDTVSIGDSIAFIAFGGSHVCIVPQSDQYIRYSMNLEVKPLSASTTTAFISSNQVLGTPPGKANSEWVVPPEGVFLLCIDKNNGYTIFGIVNASAVWTPGTAGSSPYYIWNG